MEAGSLIGTVNLIDEEKTMQDFAEIEKAVDAQVDLEDLDYEFRLEYWWKKEQEDEIN